MLLSSLIIFFGFDLELKESTISLIRFPIYFKGISLSSMIEFLLPLIKFWEKVEINEL